MNGSQLREKIGRERRPGQEFVKWWRREHDFLNFELLDVFLGRTGSDDIKWLEGYELLTMDEMWKELEKRAPGRARKEKRRGEEVIIRNPGKSDQEVLPLRPDILMAIFDEETGGDVID